VGGLPGRSDEAPHEVGGGVTAGPGGLGWQSRHFPLAWGACRGGRMKPPTKWGVGSRLGQATWVGGHGTPHWRGGLAGAVGSRLGQAAWVGGHGTPHWRGGLAGAVG